MENFNEEDIKARHRRELKELNNKVTGLKKQAQADKKRKKELLKEIEDLQKATEERHRKELMQIEISETSEILSEQSAIQLEELQRLSIKENVNTASASNEKSEEEKVKVNRQKLRKQRKNEKLEQMKMEAKAEPMIDYKAIEAETFAKLLKEHGKGIVQVVPDGHW
jgi:OTU domain-containing protein 6